MDAQVAWAVGRPHRVCLASLTLAVLCLAPVASQAAAYRTANFTVDAPTPQLAKEIGDQAESCRSKLAVEWLGRELPAWTKPCPIKAMVAPHLGAGGATSFVFDRGQVFGWDMKVQGSRERVLDSVIPHEVTHTIFATHFRQPLPRWADEGACTTVEHRSEIAKQERMLIDFLKTHRGIPFDAMFVMTEYPHDVLPLYAQGHSLARFLIDQRGKREFLTFLADGMQDQNWRRAIDQHYGYEHLLALQNSWLDWIKAGRPQMAPAGNTMLASTQTPTPPAPPESRGEVGAGMGALAHEIEPSRPVAMPTAPKVNVPPTATRGASAALSTASGEQRSVYGENAAWRPQRRQPIVPASTTSSQQQAAAGAVAYDASRESGTSWR
jgi:hypothetical protein